MSTYTTPVLPTVSRASRYLDVSNDSRAVTEIETSLVSYSWRVENRAETPVSTLQDGTYGVTVQFQFRYVFEHVVKKTFNKSISGNAMSSGFGSTTDPSKSGSQTKAYPDPKELQVFKLPQILTDDDFVGGDRKWHLQSYDITADADTGINELQATLVARTHWMNMASQSSKCAFPAIGLIKDASEFPK